MLGCNVVELPANGYSLLGFGVSKNNTLVSCRPEFRLCNPLYPPDILHPML